MGEHRLARHFALSSNGERVVAIFEKSMTWLNLGSYPVQARSIEQVFAVGETAVAFDDGGVVVFDHDHNLRRFQQPGAAPQFDRVDYDGERSTVRLLDTAQGGHLLLVEWIEKRGFLSKLKGSPFRASVRLKRPGKGWNQFCEKKLKEQQVGTVTGKLSARGKCVAVAALEESDWKLVVVNLETGKVLSENNFPFGECPQLWLDDSGHALAIAADQLYIVDSNGQSVIKPLEGELLGVNQSLVYVRIDEKIVRQPWSPTPSRATPNLQSIANAFFLSGEEEAVFYPGQPVEFATGNRRQQFLAWFLEEGKRDTYRQALAHLVQAQPSGSWMYDAQIRYEIVENEHGWLARLKA